MQSNSKGQYPCILKNFWGTLSFFVFSELTKNITRSYVSVYVNLILIVTPVLIELLLAMFAGPKVFFPLTSNIYILAFFEVLHGDFRSLCSWNPLTCIQMCAANHFGTDQKGRLKQDFSSRCLTPKLNW